MSLLPQELNPFRPENRPLKQSPFVDQSDAVTGIWGPPDPDTCPSCNQHWDLHELGVPAPYCPGPVSDTPETDSTYEDDLRAKCKELELERNAALKLTEIRQRDREAAERRAAVAEGIITRSLRELPVGNVHTHTPESTPGRISDLVKGLAESDRENTRLEDKLTAVSRTLEQVAALSKEDFTKGVLLKISDNIATRH